MSERQKMWLIFAIAAAIMGLCFLSVLSARACECCTDPVVKAEWRGNEWRYEIGGPETIVVTGTERLLCYEVVSGTAITEIRTKAGQGVECIYPQGEEQARGCIEADWHDLSSVWFCNDGPTAVELSSFTAETGCDCLTYWGLVKFVALFMAGCFVTIGFLRVTKR